MKNELRQEELERIFNNHEYAKGIIEDQIVNGRCIENYQKLIKFINGFHNRAFNNVAISHGDPKNMQSIGDRIIRTFKRKIDCGTMKARNAYDNIQDIQKGLYYLYCKFLFFMLLRFQYCN